MEIQWVKSFTAYGYDGIMYVNTDSYASYGV